MDDAQLQNIIHAIIQAATKAVSVEELEYALQDELKVTRLRIKQALVALSEMDHQVQELRKVAGGYRFYIKQAYATWVAKQKDGIEHNLPMALKETLAIIAYKQPISHGEINLIRCRSTHLHVINELLDRGWIKVVAYGGESSRAVLYGTTVGFLDHFDLNSVHDLPAIESFELEKL